MSKLTAVQLYYSAASSGKMTRLPELKTLAVEELLCRIGTYQMRNERSSVHSKNLSFDLAVTYLRRRGFVTTASMESIINMMRFKSPTKAMYLDFASLLTDMDGFISELEVSGFQRRGVSTTPHRMN